MELLVSENYVTILDCGFALWVERTTGHYSANPHGNVPADSKCIGKIYGYIGKIQTEQGSELFFIRQVTKLGTIKGHEIYKINSACSVALETESELYIEQCLKPDCYNNRSSVHTTTSLTSSPSIIKTRVPPCNACRNVRRNEGERIERRLYDEVHKMFYEGDAFYFSPTYSITNTLQRIAKLNSDSFNSGKHSDNIFEFNKENIWKDADKRFFWNHEMLSFLLTSEDENLHRWVTPIIYGFVQCGKFVVDSENSDQCSSAVVWLLSRRSRFQAGTRYLRRGIDDDGNVANFVETEQILISESDISSYVIVRGSVPLYWSQQGLKYRPPIKLEREIEQNQRALRLHFNEQIALYDKVHVVNLIDKSGREKVLGDAFIKHILDFDSENLSYITFDFHKRCGTVNFENIQLLLAKVAPLAKSVGYFRYNSECGIAVQSQNGIFRVNCIDCLDRTNAVQTAFTKLCLLRQLLDIGLCKKEENLQLDLNKLTMNLWGDNGDALSKQYAGTNALKADFTRTGERKISGVVKDGMKSANRYYVNCFRDRTRQAAIDLMLGNRSIVSEDEIAEDSKDAPELTPQQIQSVLEERRGMVVPKEETVLGSWGLVNARISDPDSLDIDVLLFLTTKAYYVSEFLEGTSNSSTCVVPLSAISSVELGFDAMILPQAFWKVFPIGLSSNSMVVPRLHISYSLNGNDGRHEFRSSSIRFFNNVPIPIHRTEDKQDALEVIAYSISSAATSTGNSIEVSRTSVKKDNFSSRPRIPNFSTAWMNKYFIRPNVTTPSGSYDSNVTENHEGNLDANLDERKRNVNLNLNDMSRNSYQHIDLIDFHAFTPVADNHRGMLELNTDIIVPSCGILSPGHRLGTGLSKALLLMTDKRDCSPISPALEVGQDPTSISPIHGFSHTHHAQHRYSLPSNTLEISTLNVPISRCKTPEITITEDNAKNDPEITHMDNTSVSSGKELAVSLRRMSRSTEDVNKRTSFGIPKLENVSSKIKFGLKFPNMFPTGASGGNKSSSGVGINVPAATMKESRSETTLKSQPVNLPVTEKRVDSVLTPLGKLGNMAFRGMQNIGAGASYLDPRKLRESFKPTTVKDANEDYELEEKKRNSHTLFIDV